ncbi:MAG: AAA family ATPase [Casimicrobiaceae bacterium]|nr:AAA family ATPase [Casimicrobiaceae bacterium]
MSAGHALVQTSGFHMPIANVRKIYDAERVEQKLGKLKNRDCEALRSTYETMIERGELRFDVKPHGMPSMAELYDELPNFAEVLDDVKRHVVLNQDSAEGLELTPMLLLGPPGVGKTHFAKRLAEMLGTQMVLAPMSSMTAGWLISGASSQWKGARPGKVFEALVEGEYANPVIVVDEIDKANHEAQYDPLGALYGLLEKETAREFVDEFADVPIDASRVIWVTTANDERAIPEPILNRMNVFEISPPSPEAARRIAANLYRTIRREHDWGRFFDEEAPEEVLDLLATLAPREMRRALMTAFGNARLDGRSTLRSEDLPKLGRKRAPIGFASS